MAALRKENIEILDIFRCPHSRKSKCNCHKPSPGLIVQALNKYPDIDLESSIYIGNSISDLALANEFRLEFFRLEFYGINFNCKNQFDSLSQIRKYIL
ncbi:hypothetical protein [Varibaculum prostatecancerukia]|uniref:hypothetical protein n=1 Tax=Varibaculum prostatecancerukia TaxID=2811781 RepID=UPI0035A58B8A